MTENTPTDTTEPVVAAPKDGPVKPDNQYNDILPEAQAAGTTKKKTAGPGAAQPANQYNDSAPKG